MQYIVIPLILLAYFETLIVAVSLLAFGRSALSTIWASLSATAFILSITSRAELEHPHGWIACAVAWISLTIAASATTRRLNARRSVSAPHT